MPPRDIDDRKPSVTEPNAWRGMQAASVGTPVGKALCHPVEQIAIDLPGFAGIDNPGYAAHEGTIL